jgi:hypothetical protein
MIRKLRLLFDSCIIAFSGGGFPRFIGETTAILDIYTHSSYLILPIVTYYCWLVVYRGSLPLFTLEGVFFDC